MADTKVGTGTVSKLELSSNTRKLKLDLRPNYLEINYYESIMASTVSLNVVIADASDIRTSLPITGGETLTYAFNDTFDTVDVDQGSPMRVYKISERHIDGGRKEAYVIHCTTDDMMQAKYKTVETTLSGMSYADMVKKILKENFNAELFRYDDTSGIHRFTASRLNPFAAIRHIAEQAEAKSKDNSSSNFFFWQNNDGGYQFKHLESLLQQPPFRKYVYYVEELQDDEKYEGTRILDFEEHVSFDLLSGITHGQYGTNVKYYDPMAKAMRETNYSYARDFGKTRHNSKYPLLSTAVNEEFSAGTTLEKFIITNSLLQDTPYVQSRDEELRNQFSRRQNFLAKSTSLNSRLLSGGMTIMVHGDARIAAGMIIEIELPTTGEKAIGDEIIDRFTSGKYLVTAVRHTISSTEYYTVMSISKESYLKNPNVGGEF